MPQPPVFYAGRKDLDGDVVILSGAEGRHAATVRRLRPGERVDVSDGAGLVAECVVTSRASAGLELAVRARREVPRPDPAITVVQAIPKGDRGEAAVEGLTEVGVDRIVPWTAARCVAVWAPERGERSLARWRSTALQAAKQSRRAWLPEVTEPASTSQVGAMITAASCAIVLLPEAGQSLGRTDPPPSGELLVVVGPEGGITDDEVKDFLAAGATARGLGPTVLRTSTAGIVAAAVLLSRAHRW
ncbi:MAG: 16S rRNA (uracil(1498)-N(3))-methyltransferase [Streptosporangiaceae bacterium]